MNSIMSIVVRKIRPQQARVSKGSMRLGDRFLISSRARNSNGPTRDQAQVAAGLSDNSRLHATRHPRE